MADNVIGIKFGVAGGKSLSGASGALIKSQLESIASQIKLKINIDKKHFTSQLSSLRKELDKTLGKVKINTNAATKTAVTGASSSAKSGNGELEKQVELYSRLKAEIKEASSLQRKADKEVTGSKKQNVLQSQASSLKAGVDAQRSGLGELQQKLNAYEAQLLKTTNRQKEFNVAVQQDKMAGSMKTSFSGLVANATALGERYSDLIKHNKNAAKVFGDLQKLSGAQYLGEDHVNSNGEKISANYAGATNQIRTLAQATKAASAELSRMETQSNTVGRSLRQAFSNKLIQGFAYVVIATATRAIRQIYTNVLELDKAITDLQIATGNTREETTELVKEYAKLAKEIGATTTEVAAAADTWLRQGYSVAEANQLIVDTMMLSKLGQLDSAEASKALTSAMKGYKVAVEDAMGIVDKFTAVDMEAAVSAGDIATAMAETAASADIAGVSMDTLIGYIATVAEVTQDGAESVGTFYKTLFARMGNVKAGKFVDDETGESLNDVEKVLSSLDITMRNEKGTFRDFSEVLDEVAGKWETYDNIQQHAIATAFAGTRQQEKFMVLMENYGSALDYANTAANSAGTAQDKYGSAYLDSIEAKMNALTASWQEFSMTLLDSDIIKFLVDVLNGIVNILNAVFSLGDGAMSKAALIAASVAGIITLLGKLQVKLGTAGQGIKAFFTAAGTSMQKFLVKSAPVLILTTIITLMTTLTGQAKGWAELIAGAVAIITTAIIVGVKGVDATIKGFMATNPIGWILLAITAVVSVVKGVIDLIESVNPSYDTLKEKAQESIDAWKSAEDELANVSSELTEIQEKIDEINAKDSLTIVDKQELEALERERAALAEIEQSKKDEAEKQKQQAIQDSIAALEKFNEQSAEPIYVYEYVFSWFGAAHPSETHESYEDKINRILADYANASQEDKDFVDNAIKEYGELTQDFKFGDSKEMDDYLYQYFKMLDSQYLHEGGDKAGIAWNRILTDERFTKEVEKLQKLADDEEVSLDAILRDAPKLVEYLKDIGVYTEGDKESSDALVQSIKDMHEMLPKTPKLDFTDDLDKMQEKVDTLSKALEDIGKIGVVSVESISKIMESFGVDGAKTIEKYFDYIDGVGYKLNEEWAGKSDSEILKSMAADDLGYYAKEVEKSREILAGLKKDSVDYQTAQENLATAQENLNTKTAEWATLLREKVIEEETKRLEELEEATNEQGERYKELIEVRKKLLSTYKEEINYQKELAEKQKAVADLQTQLALARLDTSAAGQARVRELEEELNDAKDELDEYTLERAIEDLTNQLDEDYSEYERFIDAKIKEITDAIEKIPENIKVEITPNIPEDNDGGEDNDDGEDNSPKHKYEDGMPGGHSPWKSYQDAADAGYSNIAGAGASERARVKNWINPYTGKNYTSYQEYLDAKYLELVGKYHTGGLVGGVASLQSNEEFAKLMKGEFVSTPKQMETFMKKTLPGLMQSGQNGAVINNNSPLIEIKCGDINQDTLPRLRELVNQAVAKIEKNMESALARTGYKKQY